jgi:hypothetical protein
MVREILHRSLVTAEIEIFASSDALKPVRVLKQPPANGGLGEI